MYTIIYKLEISVKYKECCCYKPMQYQDEL